MRLLCVARHPFLSEHLCRYFEELGFDTVACVGMREAADGVPLHDADAVICDYDLLASVPTERWEQDDVLSTTPIIAVSLTRHPGEAHLNEASEIAGFLYLPTLQAEDAQRFLKSLPRRRRAITPPNSLPWPGQTQHARRR
jgi:hypothetical protein